MDETGYLLLVIVEKRRVGDYQKMKTDLAVTIQSSTLSSVEAESLYKTSPVIKVAKAERNPLFSARDFKAATGFPGQKDTIISRLKAAGLRARHAAVKELLTDEHKLYLFTFAESNVDRKWVRVIFTDESTFSSAKMGQF
jgi:hypothetical protein